MAKLATYTSSIRANLISTTFNKFLNSRSSVLDIGCGTGVVVSQLIKKYKFKKAFGCDIENYLIEPINFKLQTDPHVIPFKNNTFDIGLFNDVLHHIDFNGQKILIKESMRVSKKVLIFELIPGIINKTGDYVLNKIHNPNMKIPFTYRDIDGWKSLFKNLGYKCQTVMVKKPKFYPFSHVGFVLSK